MVIVVIALIVGILFGEFSALYPFPLYLLLAAVACVAAAVFVCRRSFSSWLFCSLVFVAFALVGIALHSHAQPRSSLAEGRYTVMLTLQKPAALSRHSTRWQCSIDSAWCDSLYLPASGNVMLYMPKSFPLDTIEVGSRFSVATALQRPCNIFATFNYADYCRRHGCFFTAYSRQFALVDTVAHAFPHRMARLQHALSQRMCHPTLSSSHQSVANAMLLGVRNGEYEAVRQQYADSGIVHLLCLSGLHVGIFSSLMALFFAWIGNSRWQRIVRYLLQIVAIWLFVFLTGMAPATVRAAVMFSFFSVSHLLCRRPYPLGCLASSAFFILCFNPLLLFDVGFQLSYSAMLGIVLLYPLLCNLVAFSRQDSSLWLSLLQELNQFLALSFSAQLFTLPCMLYYFHHFYPYSLLPNLLIVPFAALMLLLTLLLLVPWLSSLSALLLDRLLSAVDGITIRVASLPYAIINVPHFSLPMALLFAVAIFFFYKALKLRNNIFYEKYPYRQRR